MNDYKPYKQLKQKQKAKVVERIYKELHQFFSDTNGFLIPQMNMNCLLAKFFRTFHTVFPSMSSMPYIIKSIPLLNSALQRKDCRNICFIVRNAGRKNRIIPL